MRLFVSAMILSFMVSPVLAGGHLESEHSRKTVLPPLTVMATIRSAALNLWQWLTSGSPKWIKTATAY